MVVDAPSASDDVLSAVCRLACILFEASTAFILPAEAAGPLRALGRAAGGAAVAVLPPEAAGTVASLCPQMPAGAGFCAVIALADAGADHGALVIADPAPRHLPSPLPVALLQQAAGLADLVRAELREQARAAAAEREASLYRLLADNSTDTIVRGDLAGNRLYISPAVHDLLGYDPETLVGRRAAELVHPDDAAAFAEVMRNVGNGSLTVARSEQRQRHKDGRWIWLEALVKLTRNPATGEPDGYVASVRDISRRKAAEERLAYLATHDALTGLANRSLLQERLCAHIAAARAGGHRLAVLCLDIDRFKQVNDSLGHDAGDRVLSAVAERLRRAAGAGDVAARIGGDEFVVALAPGTDTGRRAERMAAALTDPVPVPGSATRTSLSIGIATASPEALAHPLAADDLLRAGDRALYAAKRAGGNRFAAVRMEEEAPQG